MKYKFEKLEFGSNEGTIYFYRWKKKNGRKFQGWSISEIYKSKKKMLKDLKEFQIALGEK